ncbi:hypothetical protein JMJ78_0000855, partial [Colletotrichum scovillei]
MMQPDSNQSTLYRESVQRSRFQGSSELSLTSRPHA